MGRHFQTCAYCHGYSRHTSPLERTDLPRNGQRLPIYLNTECRNFYIAAQAQGQVILTTPTTQPARSA